MQALQYEASFFVTSALPRHLRRRGHYLQRSHVTLYNRLCFLGHTKFKKMAFLHLRHLAQGADGVGTHIRVLVGIVEQF